MRVFRHIVDLSSFSLAAARMEMSVSMVSRHIAQLETALNTRLLNRNSRHVSLTESGRLYFQHCCEVLDSVDDIKHTLHSKAAAPQGTLRITAPVWFSNPRFSRLLAAYRERYPQVSFEVELSDSIRTLVEDGYDLALSANRPLHDTLIARPFGRVLYHLVAAPAYLARMGEPGEPADLARHHVLQFPQGAGGTPLRFAAARSTAQPAQVTVRPVLESNSESLVLNAAVAGLGLAVLPCWLVEDTLAQGALREVMLPYRPEPAPLYAAYASRKHLSPNVRTFIDFLVEQVGSIGNAF